VVKGARREKRRSCEVLQPSAACQRGAVLGCRREELGLGPGLSAGEAWAEASCQREELGLRLPAPGAWAGAADTVGCRDALR
jgi:hypothetical protein